MDSVGHVVVPLRAGKKMKKRRELDALVAHSLAKRACNSGGGTKRQAGNGINSQDQLLSQSTDDQDDYTWSKVRMSPPNRTKRWSCLKTCGPLLFLLSIFVLFSFMYWLYFDLRQQISEHRIRIEQVSATSQNMPEELQKWHETSKSLENNQTEMNRIISEFQKRLDNFQKELTNVKELILKEDERSEAEQITVLQTNIANFGAKIKDLSIDVDDLKDNVHKLQTSEVVNKEALDKLKKNYESIVNNTSLSSNNNPNNNNINNNNISIDLLNNLNKTLTNDLTNLSVKLNNVNDTLSQKTKGLEDDLYAHKTKVDGLVENFANMSSHVTSIEDDWTTYKQKSIDFEQTTSKINSEILNLKNNSNRMATTINFLQDEFERSNRNIIDTPIKNSDQKQSDTKNEIDWNSTISKTNDSIQDGTNNTKTVMNTNKTISNNTSDLIGKLFPSSTIAPLNGNSVQSNDTLLNNNSTNSVSTTANITTSTNNTNGFWELF